MLRDLVQDLRYAGRTATKANRTTVIGSWSRVIRVALDG